MSFNGLSHSRCIKNFAHSPMRIENCSAWNLILCVWQNSDAPIVGKGGGISRGVALVGLYLVLIFDILIRRVSMNGFIVDHCLLTVGFKAIVNLPNWVWTESRRVNPLRRALISSDESICRSAGKHLYTQFQVAGVSIGTPGAPFQEANAKGII
jgi:hypothetical protein